VKTKVFLHAAVEAHERQYIREALAECNWNVSEAASVLGISLSSLYRKITRYGIKR